MPLTRSVATVTILVALTTIIGAGYAVSNQALSAAPTSITTDPSMATVTVTQTITDNGVSTVTQIVTQTITQTAAQETTTTRTVTQTVSQSQTTTTQSVIQSTQSTSTTQTTSVGSGTIGIYSQVANYSIVPVSNGMHPAYLGSHYDLYIPMHVMDWYTVSCGTSYSIAGTLYSYNYYPPYHGVGNLEVYANATYNEMITGTQILSFTSNGTSSVTFAGLFTAC